MTDQTELKRTSTLHQGDSLAASVVVLVCLAGAQRLVGLLRNVLFCGMLQDQELGRWSLSYNFLLLAAPFVVLGIPGSFGRYVEAYRQKGQLRAFLLRTLSVSAALTVVGTIGILAAPRRLAWLLFDDPGQWRLVLLLAATLAAVLVFNFLVELLTALRLVRIVSLMQMASSVSFALLGCGLLCFTSWHEEAVIVAYGGGALLAAVGGAVVVRRFWRELPAGDVQLPQRDLWAKLLPFAGWIWLGNLVANLFQAADQFMLKHFSALEATAADALVGQYYSSRIVPLLFVSLATMLAASLLPHLIKDWEGGRREIVCQHINQAVKLVSLAFTAAAAGVLLFAPLLFTWVLGGKYDAGLAVLPGTLVYCVWYCIACVAASYLLCAENAKTASLALAMGLVANVILNYLLAPRFGLAGVVAATATANAIALAMLYFVSWQSGMRWDEGVIFASLLPLALCLGGWQAGAVTLLATFVAWRADWWFAKAEKRELMNILSAMNRSVQGSLRINSAVST
jgi:O-antigen/teichoic acid export membrane protein